MPSTDGREPPSSCRTGPGKELGINQPLVLIVRINPDPVVVLVFRNRQSAVVPADAGDPEIADSLEPQGRIGRVIAKSLEVAASCALDRFGQCGKMFPELGNGSMH